MNFGNKSGEISKVESFYSKKRASQLATVKNTSIIICIVLAALCFVGGIVSLVCNGSVDGDFLIGVMVFLFIVAVALALGAVATYFGNKKKREDIVTSTEKSLASAKETIEAIFAEYAKYIAKYEENDRLSDDIIFAIKR